MVISEINYHAPNTIGTTAVDDLGDFIELANSSAAPIDLSGWSFTEGVLFTFPAGTVLAGDDRIVVAQDSAMFSSIYGTAPDYVWTAGEKLKNSTEPITLVDAAATTIDKVTYADTAPWPGAPDGTGPSLELRDLFSDNTLAESWGPSTGNGGTPGGTNSIEGTAPAPTITGVTATPARPNPDQPVQITATLPKGASATLTYKILFGADVAVPFLDDLASPGGANDGVYAASIPGQAQGSLIRYRIDGTKAGVGFSEPAAGDTAKYRGVVVLNPSVSTQLPVIEWFMEDSVYNDLRANHREDDVQGAAVWSYNGQVYDNVLMNIRGGVSRQANKNNWKVELPKGYEWDMGGKLPYALDEFALQNLVTANADIAWDTVEKAGARSLTIIPVRTQRNGQFWSLGRIMETEDGTWRDDQGVDDWAIYKGDGGSVGRTSSQAVLQANAWLDKKTREDEDYTDVWTLSNTVDANPSAAQQAWIYQNVNVPELINYMAINSLIRHQDSGWHNWWLARDTEGTGRWEMWHWDLDLTFGNPTTDDKGLFLTPDTSNNFTQAMLAYPEFKEMFYRRLRTLADQFLTPGQYEAQWDAIAGPTTSDWTLDRAMWGSTAQSGARSRFITGLADRRNAIANNTPALVPTSQSASANVVINEIQYKAANTGDDWVELANPGSTAVDISGWTLSGGIDLTIQAGTVLPAGAASSSSPTTSRSAPPTRQPTASSAASSTGAVERRRGDHPQGGHAHGRHRDLRQHRPLARGCERHRPVARARLAHRRQLRPGQLARDVDDGRHARLCEHGRRDPVQPGADRVVHQHGERARRERQRVRVERQQRNGHGLLVELGRRHRRRNRRDRDAHLRSGGDLHGHAHRHGQRRRDGFHDPAGHRDGRHHASPAGTLAADTFGRTSTGSFGTAETGGAWTVSGTASNYSVANGTGRFSTAAGSERNAYLNSVSSNSSDLRVSVALTRPTASTVYVGAYGRRVGSDYYRARASVSTSGAVVLQLQHGTTTLRTGTVSGLTFNNGDTLQLRVQVTGTSPTTIQAKVWKSGTEEPFNWTLTTTDTTAALQAAGSVGLYAYTSSGGAPSPNVVSWDNLSVTGAGGGTPTNAAPTAAFSSTTNALTANVNGSGSTDSDGTIAGYSWNWGDNTAAGTGATATHTYATAGTYTVTLTVTDNGGATGTVSHQVAVSATPPANTPPTAAFTSTVNGLTASLNGSTSSDPGGSIATYAWQFGDGTTGTGATTSHAYATAGTYQVTLTVTDNQGATGTVTNPVTVTSTPPAGAAFAADTFERTSTNGFGTAQTGGAWTVSSTTSNYAVNGGTGKFTDPAGSERNAYLVGASSASTDLTFSAAFARPTSGTVYVGGYGRRVGTESYRPRVTVTASGVVALQLQRVNGTTLTTLRSGTVAGLTFGASDSLSFRIQVFGTTTPTVQAKVWRTGTAEPAAWTLTATDTAATTALRGAGSIGLYSYYSSGSTPSPVTINWDNLTARPVQ
nr:PKD domain-containing protein [Naasia aerilata]